MISLWWFRQVENGKNLPRQQQQCWCHLGRCSNHRLCWNPIKIDQPINRKLTFPRLTKHERFLETLPFKIDKDVWSQKHEAKCCSLCAKRNCGMHVPLRVSYFKAIDMLTTWRFYSSFLKNQSPRVKSFYRLIIKFTLTGKTEPIAGHWWNECHSMIIMKHMIDV